VATKLEATDLVNTVDTEEENTHVHAHLLILAHIVGCKNHIWFKFLLDSIIQEM